MPLAVVPKPPHRSHSGTASCCYCVGVGDGDGGTVGGGPGGAVICGGSSGDKPGISPCDVV